MRIEQYKCCVILIVLQLFCINPIFTQSIILKGKISDAKSGEALAFVSISSSDKRFASMSDIEGNFTLKVDSLVQSLVFTYVGYEQKTVFIIDADLNQIKLNPSALNLKTAIIVAGENPAHRIIRQTVKQKDKHNPEKQGSYTCQLYNKLILTGINDSSAQKLKDPEEIKRKESADSLFDTQHLFLMESVSNRSMKDGKINEEVIASKVSGFKDASFLLLMMQLQPFVFYDDFIGISGINYFNPISKNSEDLYFFTIQDTLFQANDTIYIISFEPRKNKNFDAMKGLIYISAPDFAIQNVIAEAVKVESTHIKIQQQYSRINNRWFPEQLNTNITFNSIKLPSYNIVGIGRNYVSNVDFNPDLRQIKFSEIEMEIKKGSSEKDSLFWDNARKEELSAIEKRTFYILDSISKADKLEFKLKALEAVFKGYIPISIFNLDLDRISGYNDYEGFRLGLGLSTNNRVSKHWSIGGHFGYGFRDRAWKFGGFAQAFLNPRREMVFEVRYNNDLVESGNQPIAGFRRLIGNERIRDVYVRLFDFTESTEANITWRWMKYLKHKLYVKQAWTRPMYDYDFLPGNLFETGNPEGFMVRETGLSFRYCFKEKFYRNDALILSLGAKNPVVWFQTAFGEVSFAGRKYVFNRNVLKIEHSKKWRKWGETSYQFSASNVVGDVPYSFLINAPGNFGQTRSLRVASRNVFETMGINEFVNDRFAAIYISHNIGTLFRIKKFAPSLAFIQHSGIGNLRKPEQHQGIAFKTMEHGFHESGFAINNLIGSSLAAYGIGFYYRYGAYHLPTLKENIAIKLTIGLNL